MRPNHIVSRSNPLLLLLSVISAINYLMTSGKYDFYCISTCFMLLRLHSTFFVSVFLFVSIILLSLCCCVRARGVCVCVYNTFSRIFRWREYGCRALRKIVYLKISCTRRVHRAHIFSLLKRFYERILRLLGTWTECVLANKCDSVLCTLIPQTKTKNKQYGS